MNRQQQNLLELLKLLDDICSRHHVIYYAAGGTVIGALRHKGFIPWDDDIDVYMTRDEFNRFREAVKEEKLTDYTLECSIDNPDYHAMIPRLVKNESTMICPYHMWGDSVAGTLIDIFILDPIPPDRKEQENQYAKFNIYSDLLTPYVHSNRNPDDLYGLYDYYHNKAKKQGKRATILELEKELFSYSEENCDSYMLRWASRPSVFPKKMMGNPKYFKFENMEIPVPCDWYGYLTQLYGPDWFEIPYPEVIDHHTNVTDFNRSYKEFIAERNRYIDQKEAEKIFDGRRDAAIRAEKKRRTIESYILKTKTAVAQCKQKEKLKENGKEITLWKENGEYGKILNVFEPFFSFQMQSSFIGKPYHAQWFRWRYPVLIPLEKKYLCDAIVAMVMTGRIRDAHKVIGVYERAGKASGLILEAKELLLKHEKIQELYYKEQYFECVQLILSCEDYEKSSVCQTYFWLAKARLQPIEEEKTELEKILKRFPKNRELQKAYGDYLYELGYYNQAMNVYKQFVQISRNGLMLQDIEERFGIKKTNLNYETTEIYKPSTIETRELELLQSLVTICDRAGIRYVCSNRIARLLLNNETLGPDRQEKRIYIDAGDADKLINAVNNSDDSNTEILYWGNKPEVKDFELIYNNRNSIYMDFEQLNRWESIGVHINVTLLRHKENGIRGKIQSVEETMLTLYNLQGIAEAEARSRCIRLKRFFSNIVIRIFGKQEFAMHLFTSLTRGSNEKKDTDYFYRQNGPFLDKDGLVDNKTYLKVDFENVETYEIGGHVYRLRKDVVEQFTQADIARMKPIPYNESLFTFRRVDCGWEYLNNFISREEYQRLPWIEFGKARADQNYYQTQYSRMWKIMCRHQDYIKVWEKYKSLLPELEILLESGQQEVLRTQLAEYDQVVRYYHNAKIGFFVNRELNDIYLKNRRYFNDINYADNLEKLAKETQYWPF